MIRLGIRRTFFALRRRIFGWITSGLLAIVGWRRLEILTVLDSNTGRSTGDVFLALLSCPILARKGANVAFITHPNHKEVVSWFSQRLDATILSENASIYADALGADNIHCFAPRWRRKSPEVQTPWRYFVLNGIKPLEVEVAVPIRRMSLSGRVFIVFPERSDNARLGAEVVAPFVQAAKAKGYACYTNCYINSNFLQSDCIPGTEPLMQLSLAEVVSVARSPEVVIFGTRSGLFDILYFTTSGGGAKLVIVYPESPEWIWGARFYNSDISKAYPDVYLHRTGVYEMKERELLSAPMCEIFG